MKELGKGGEGGKEMEKKGERRGRRGEERRGEEGRSCKM